MKKITIITALFLITLKLFAQDCSDYIFMKKGRTIETTSYNAEGKVMNKAVMLVNAVTSANGTTTATLTAKNFNQNGTSGSNTTVTYKCDNGTLVIDFSSLMPHQANFQFNTVWIDYPANMAVGQHFGNVEMAMNMNLGGKTITIYCQITERAVIDEESLTTPAGTWKCFRMTYKMYTTYSGLNMPPSFITATEWYVPNFAIVQWQLGALVTKITAIKN